MTVEQIRQIETNLLTAFHNFARTTETQMRDTKLVVSRFDERLSLFETRVSELERHRAS